MPTLKRMILVVVFSISPTFVFAGDLDTLQGEWETTFEQGGRIYRAVKSIKGKTETVEVCDGDRLMKRHSVDFDLDERDGIRTFIYRNGQITFGTGSPGKLPDGKYIYRIDGDKWIGIYGAFSNDNGPAYVQTFKKVAQ